MGQSLRESAVRGRSAGRRLPIALSVALLVIGVLLKAGVPAAAAEAPDELRELPGLELYGIVIEEPGDRYAFVHDGNPGGQIRKLRVGQTISGALVTAILPDQVTFVMSGNEYALLLRAYKAGVQTTGLLNEGVASRGLNESSEAIVELSPQPLQLADPTMPLIKNQPQFPERGPSRDPPWQPPPINKGRRPITE